MASKHNLTHASEVYIGGGYDARTYGANGRPGVPVCFMTRCDLGSPIATDDDFLIDDATSTELPSNATKTYTPLTQGSSPTDNADSDSSVATITTATGSSVLVWTLDVPRNITVASSSAAADTVVTVTGYDYWKVKMVEAITVASGQSATAGLKAFKYVSSIAIYSAGNITSDTIKIGFADVLGLPYKLANKADCFRVYFNDVLDDAATVVKADATSPATATTGDVRGTVDTNSAADGSAVVVYMTVLDPGTAIGLRGVAQFAG